MQSRAIDLKLDDILPRTLSRRTFLARDSIFSFFKIFSRQWETLGIPTQIIRLVARIEQLSQCYLCPKSDHKSPRLAILGFYGTVLGLRLRKESKQGQKLALLPLLPAFGRHDH